MSAVKAGVRTQDRSQDTEKAKQVVSITLSQHLDRNEFAGWLDNDISLSYTN